MIHRIGADRQSFKTLAFSPGLNVLLADRTADATDKDSRNGSGKTSFVELVHFLLGSGARRESIFRSAALEDWRFEMEIDLGKGPITVVRSGRKPNRVELSGALPGTVSRPAPSLIDDAPTAVQGLEPWKTLLGEEWFRLAGTAEGPDRFGPSSRSLVSYFVRRAENGGFLEPTQSFKHQQTWDQQVCLSWMLDLDWTVSQGFQVLREREKGVKGLKQAVRTGELSGFVGSAAEIRAALALGRSKAQKMKDRLEKFRVLPDYEELEKEADELTGRINGLAAENVADRTLIRELETSMREEGLPGEQDLKGLFEEAGVVLPGLVERRFEEVHVFHRRVMENRRAHLSAELESARERVGEREARKEQWDRRRRRIMEILGTGGALAEYTALREEVGRMEAKVHTLDERLRSTQKLERLQTELRMERARLRKALEDDIEERGPRIDEATIRFQDLSEALYEHYGHLTIGAGDGGLRFEVKIPSGRSRGITNMQIFCFDLMLMDLLAERGRSPGFLIHDSHLFDGVDERQVARALQVGAQRAEAGGFQYIVTLNTDAIPKEGFDAGFALEDYFMEVRLTDAREDGGLFGVRFD